MPYGLYRAEGYVSANLARKVTGFSEEDLELLWEAIITGLKMIILQARGKMAAAGTDYFQTQQGAGRLSRI